MKQPPACKARYSHLGICVSDLERALAFYVNVFGFVERSRLTVENELGPLLSMVGDIALRSIFLRLDGLLIELLHFRLPGCIGQDQPRRLNQLGLTHLSLNVNALDMAAEQVRAWGGSVLAETRTSFALPHMAGEIMFVMDPDGTRIELMAFPEDVSNG